MTKISSFPLKQVITEVIADRQITNKLVIVASEHISFAIKDYVCVSNVFTKLYNKFIFHVNPDIYKRKCAVHYSSLDIVLLIFENNTIFYSFSILEH